MSAERVYLLANFGLGLRVAAWWPNDEAAPRSRADMTTSGRDAPTREAREWFLVECDNATAGRRAVRCKGMTACDGPGPTGCDGDACPFGRVIDSGGAA